MRIVDVETYPVGAGWKNWLFVRVVTDGGLHGVGEATLNGLTRACEAAVQELKHLVIGRDPRAVRRNAAELYNRISNEGGHVHRAAIAGIEVACWDILGKWLDVPVYQLFGGRARDRVPCYANGWYRTDRDPSAFADAARGVIGQGFRALKFDPLGTARGFFSPSELDRTRDAIVAVRQAVGPEVRILIDVHARLAPAEAVVLCEACSDLDVFWWEEPTTRHHEEATLTVASKVVQRIATGENFHTASQFIRLAQDVSIWQPEPMALGGLLPAASVCDLAAAQGAWVAPHQSGGPIATAVCLQLAAFAQNFLIQEHFDPFNEMWTRTLVTWAPTLDPATGELDLPEAPGIGVDLRVDVASEHPYNPKAYLDVTQDGWERRLGEVPIGSSGA